MKTFLVYAKNVRNYFAQVDGFVPPAIAKRELVSILLDTQPLPYAQNQNTQIQQAERPAQQVAD